MSDKGPPCPTLSRRHGKTIQGLVREKIANELVDWFNQVDATYRNDLPAVRSSGPKMRAGFAIGQAAALRAVVCLPSPYEVGILPAAC